MSAAGANAGTNIVAGTVNAGLDASQQAASSITGAVAGTTNKNNEAVNNSISTTPVYDNTLNQALNNATANLGNQQQYGGNNGDIPTYTADDSYSSIQASKSSSKAGWCFIGEDRGFRSCIQVGENDQCMSGDIFPSEEICVNPTLRM